MLALACARYRWRVLAYCLMTNHYHLLVQTPEANHVLLVQEDEHPLTALRYIVRNPLRARMREQAGEWPWSSHAATIGARPPGLLALDRLLSYFAERREDARRMYWALVEDDEDLPPAAHSLVDGDPAFVLAQLARVEPSPEFARAHVTPPRPALAELVASSSDAAAMLEAHRRHGYSMRQIATHLGCGLTTVAFASSRSWRTVQRRVEHGRPDPGSREGRGSPRNGPKHS